MDEYTAQQGNQTLGDDKIKVAFGTLRTKVLVQESECVARDSLCPSFKCLQPLYVGQGVPN